MSGLTNTESTIEIKAGAAELASVFADILDAIKNAPTAYKQMVEEHKALKVTKTEHQTIFTDNERILAEHKASRVAFSEEQKKANAKAEKAEKEMAEREDEVLRQQNAIKAQQVAMAKKDKEQKDTTTSLSAWEARNKQTDSDLAIRESKLRTDQKQVDSDKDVIRSKEDMLRKVIG